jgi:hypothetical protein
MTRLLAAVLTAVSMTMLAPAEARLVFPLSYKQLFKDAELVVIANAVSCADADKHIKNEQGDNSVPVLTSFKVLHVVKGAYERPSLVLLHYRLKEGVLIFNGPDYVKFDTAQKRDLTGWAWPSTAYMLFLKKRRDGRYECVGGQTDPGFAVKKLTLEIWVSEFERSHRSAIDRMTYEGLFKDADLVVIASPLSTKEAAKEKQSQKNTSDQSLAVLTTLKVKHVVKGKLAGNKLVLLHHRLKKDVTISPEPLYLSFDMTRSTGIEIEIEKGASRTRTGPPVATYLIFLKKRSDGYYECVTGQTASTLAVNKVN